MVKQTYFSRHSRKGLSLRKSIAALSALALIISGSVLQLTNAATEPYSWQQLSVSTNGVASGVSGMSADGNTLYVASGGDEKTFYSPDKGVTWLARAYPSVSIFELAVSADGTKLVGLNNSNVYISTDSAQTWSAAYPVGCNASTLDMSADGTKLIVGCLNGYIYTSANGGLSWTQRTGAGSHRWQTVTISTDGTRMAAAESYTPTSTLGAIYTSTDSGATWVQQTGAGSRYWKSVDMSGDGSRLVASAWQTAPAAAPSEIYRSLDSGTTWTLQSGLGASIDSGSGVIISRDGQTVISVIRQNDNPAVRVSTDGGVSWAYTKEFDFYYDAGGMAVSLDGNTILMPSQQGPVVLSIDRGVDWSIVSDIRSTSVGWTDVATTIDGKKAWFANWYPSGPLQHTPDGGTSWQDIDSMGSHDWDGVATSSDGQYITAVGGCSWAETYVYVSSDTGQTWTKKMTDQTRPWDEVAMSADGRVQAATVCHGYLYMSTDYGQTWSARMTDQARDWTDIMVSADGTRLTALSYGDGIFSSADSGQNWMQSTSAGSRSYYHGAMTASGKTILAGTDLNTGDFVYRSDDYGVTWQPMSVLGSKRWQSAAMSADGNKMAVVTRDVVADPGVYISTDGGLSWEIQPVPADYYNIAMSADGTVLYGAAWANVRKATSATPPIAPPIPSTNVVAGAASISGSATPGSLMHLTLPGGQIMTQLAAVTGEYTLNLSDGMSLKTGDVLSLRQQSAAGVLGAATMITVQAPIGSLADTGVSLWVALTIAGGLVAVSLLLTRRYHPRRMTF